MSDNNAAPYVEPQFTGQDLDETNIADLQKWIDEEQLYGLIDEEQGGILNKEMDKFKELSGETFTYEGD